MKKTTGLKNPAAHYDLHGILGEVEDTPLAFSLDAQLREQIIHGKRGRRLQNVSVKLDAVHIQALRKIATRRSIPYQTLIRQFLADAIRRELRLAG